MDHLNTTFDPMTADIEDVLDHLDQNVRSNDAAWPSTLVNLVDLLSSHFVRRDKLATEVAKVKAQDIVVVLAGYFGGRQVYLPRNEKLRLALRDQQVWHSFSGFNIKELEQRWRLTSAQLYNILARQRKLHSSGKNDCLSNQTNSGQ